MKDRFGNHIVVGWSDHHIVWLEAAMTLAGPEQEQAIRDIAELTGRSKIAVVAKMRRVMNARWYEEQKAKARAWNAAHRMAAHPALTASDEGA